MYECTHHINFLCFNFINELCQLNLDDIRGLAPLAPDTSLRKLTLVPNTYANETKGTMRSAAEHLQHIRRRDRMGLFRHKKRKQGRRDRKKVKICASRNYVGKFYKKIRRRTKRFINGTTSCWEVTDSQGLLRI